MPWPLPDELVDPEGRGRYVKRSESQLPPQPPDSHLVRGAEYFWEGNEEGAVPCGVIGCSNLATHTWSGHPTCDDCAIPMRKSSIDESVLGCCPHGVDLDHDFCPKGCRV